MRNRWFLAFGIAVVAGLAITALFSRTARRSEARTEDAASVWKARTGVDLDAFARMHPPQPDSDDARALDAIVAPIGLRLGARSAGRRQPADMDALVEALRAAIRAETPKPLPPSVVKTIEGVSTTLDAVAEFVGRHDGIRWREDFTPRPTVSRLYTADHLTLHRLLIGRAFLALERGDRATAERMVATSRRLQEVLEKRQELWSQFAAIGIERMHLALIRRGGAAPALRDDRIRERYLQAMSAEAIVTLANARRRPTVGDDDGPEFMMRLLAAPKFEAAASEAVTIAAETVSEIRRSADGCAELTRVRRKPREMFAGTFFAVDATDAWRRFVLLETDRAITAAVLTGETSSPCPSVTITVRDEGSVRTVTTEGFPPQPDYLVEIPSVVTTRREP